MLEHEERLLTLADAAKRLGIHPSTLRGWADRGLIPHVRLPTGHRRFLAPDVDRLRREIGLERLDPDSGSSR